MSESIRILVVGQLPPPRHGQAVMLDYLLQGEYRGVELIHVPLAFSRDLADVGVFRPGKILHLFATIARIATTRVRSGATVLYYPPAGPFWVPVIRDLAILLSTRWMFDRTVFHFHAGGLSSLLTRAPGPLRWACRIAYGDPDVAIRTSRLAPPDPEAIRAAVEVVVPNGIPDPLDTVEGARRAPAAPLRILNVGLQSEAKGTLILVEAIRLLRLEGASLELVLVGGFESTGFQRQVEGLIDDAGLAACVFLAGELEGGDKWDAYRDADLFCFATQHEGESFGLVLLEAFAFALPVVASRLNAIPEIVLDGECGLLFDTGDASDLKGCLARLMQDPVLRERLGRKGRDRFVEMYSITHYRQQMQAVFDLVRGGLPR